MALPWLLLLGFGLLWGDAAAAEAEEATCSSTEACTSTQPHFSPNRGVDLNRTGRSLYSPVRNLSRPAWSFPAPKRSFHQTPVLDKDYNIYTGSDDGSITSLDKNGNVRWQFQVGSFSSQCPSIHGDRVYTASGNGIVVALEAATGKVLWQTPIADRGNPPDTYAITATEDVILAPANAMPGVPFGAYDVVALNTADGSIRWRYNVGGLHHSLVVNFLPVVHDGSAIFSDSAGGVYRISLKDGTEQWYRAGDDPGSFGLGGVCLGPNGILYVGSTTPNSPHGKGLLKAMDLSGKEVWRRSFALEFHAAPAIGPLGTGGPLALVIGAGTPTGYPPTLKEWLGQKLGLAPAPYTEGVTYALDAETGKDIWTFRPEPWREQACVGSTWFNTCLPDLWSLALLTPEGTAYINWSAGGVTYALRDANGDGVVDEKDPREVQSFSAGTGSTGPPVAAPGFLLVAGCRSLYAFIE